MTPDKNKNTPRGMTPEHKAAIAEGRDQARIVSRYLEALEAHKPKRGRKITKDSIQKKLRRIEQQLNDNPTPIDRLTLTQERKNLLALLGTQTTNNDLKTLETEFIKIGKAYADRKGITRQTFTEIGVPNTVLKAAGI